MSENKVEFYGGWVVSIIPMVVFLISCIVFFVWFKVFDMVVLAVGGFLGLLLGAVFAKSSEKYWNSVMKGIGSPTSVAIVVILLIIGIFTKLMAVSGVSQGFVWLADIIGMKGGIFTAFTFLSTCLITTATGSSIGTLFTAFPILFPAGILLGSNPGVLAGAILSGAVFGDNLAPISDVTIATSSTQEFKNKTGTADIAGVVLYRLKYALIAGIISLVLFAIFGGGGTITDGAEAILEQNMNPAGLWMLLPVIALLFTSIKTRDIFKSVTVGIVTGTVIGLITGVFTLKTIFCVENGVIKGFVFEGFSGMIGICIFCIALFGIMGVLEESGTMNKVIETICQSKLSKTVRGTELLIAIGTIVVTALLGGVTSASTLTYGPVVNDIGKRMNIHPYRRANFLSGYANSLPAIIPFISAFIFISATVIEPMSKEFDYIPQVMPIDITLGSFYPIMLFIVLTISILTGWDVKFEGKNGELSQENI
ncbi:Na+/H+ antiporter NhaC family protein (plasmid) [Fusobacterium sp. SB021]|uniref:Na+/H+ antiporter NhaC family protein n=1 Tax=Fusobacterium sp. SB021 TaxID=2744227 RepID=UPI003CF34CB6